MTIKSRTLITTRASLKATGGMENYVSYLAEASSKLGPVSLISGMFYGSSNFFLVGLNIIKVNIDSFIYVWLQRPSHWFAFGHTVLWTAILPVPAATKIFYFGLGYELFSRTLEVNRVKSLKNRLHRILFSSYKRKVHQFMVIEENQVEYISAIPGVRKVGVLYNPCALKTVKSPFNSFPDELVITSVGRDDPSKFRAELLEDWVRFRKKYGSYINANLTIITPRASSWLKRYHGVHNIYIVEGATDEQRDQIIASSFAEVSYSRQGTMLLTLLEAISLDRLLVVNNSHNGELNCSNSVTLDDLGVLIRDNNFAAIESKRQSARVILAKRSISNFDRDVASLYG